MPTGLPPGKTADHPDWVVDFCNFRAAWLLPPKPGGKSMGEAIIVIHPDTGFTIHPELMKGDRYLIDKAKNFIDPGQPAVDELRKSGLVVIEQEGVAKYLAKPTTTYQERFPSHGTATASVIMSEEGHPNRDDPNQFPNYSEINSVTGVAPRVKVIPIKVTETVVLWAQQSIDLAKAINYAVSLSKSSTILDNDNSQIGVISISLGGMNSIAGRSPLKTALEAAKNAGIVVVASAGQLNDTFGKLFSPAYPGSDSNTICAAACGPNHERYIKGLYDGSVDITAPGDKVWEARAERVPGFLNNYFVDQSDGTSYSAAIVAGACALWQAHHGRANLLNTYGPELIFDLFKKVLRDSCHTPAGWDTARRGAGVLDAEMLLKEPLPPKTEIEAIRGG